MPKNAFERSVAQGLFCAAEGIVPRVALGCLIKHARLPRVDGRTADGTGYQTYGHPWRRFGHRDAERSPESDASGLLVEVDRINRRHPCSRPVQHQHARVRGLVGWGYGSAAGHV